LAAVLAIRSDEGAVHAFEGVEQEIPPPSAAATANGCAVEDLAGGQCADRHRRPTLLRAPRHRLQAHGGGQHAQHAHAAAQGGSTITQQLARNLYPEEIGRAVSNRKAKEAITALKIEHAYSKDEILETYLNTVPFLYNAFGIEMAARTYFDKSAAKLDVLESATLIGMLKGTSYYNPVLNPERALKRRNIVLAQMAKHGKLRPEQRAAAGRGRCGWTSSARTSRWARRRTSRVQVRRWLIDLGRPRMTTTSTPTAWWCTPPSTRALQEGREPARGANSRPACRSWPTRRNGATAGRPASRHGEAVHPRERAVPGGARGGRPRQAKLRGDAECGARELQAGFLAMDPATAGARLGRQPRLRAGPVRPRAPGAAPARLDLQALRLRRGLRAGLSPDDTFIDEAVDHRRRGGAVWRPRDGTPPTNQPMTLRDGLASRATASPRR
jgi:penicillin-binding protein 1A